MNYEILQIDNSNGLHVVTISRPKALNALNRQTFDELRHFFVETVPHDSSVKGVIITGAGDRAFVAGADIKEFLDFGETGGAELSKSGQDVFFAIENCRVPVIAAVNGFALGGGCELAMACHLRVASEKARFGQPEVNLGIIPGYGGTQRLPMLIGKSKAMEFILTGDMIDANEAHRLGLANYVVPAEELMVKATALLTKITGKAPIAVAQSIQCVNAAYNPAVNGFDFEVQAFGNTSNTEDFVEGAKAFQEKRKPNFKGS